MSVEFRTNQVTIHTEAAEQQTYGNNKTLLPAAYRDSIINAGQQLHSNTSLPTIFEASNGISKKEAAVGTIAKSTGLMPTTTAPNNPATAPQDEYTIEIDFDTSLHIRTLFCELSHNFSLITKIKDLDFQEQDKTTLNLSAFEVTDLMDCLQNMVAFSPELSTLKNAIDNLMLEKMLAQAGHTSEPVVSTQQTPDNRDKQIRDYVLGFANKDSTLRKIDWDSGEPPHFTTEENAEYIFCLKTALANHPEYESILRPLITDLEPENPYLLSKKLYLSEGGYVATVSLEDLAKLTLDFFGFLDLSGTDSSDEDISTLATNHPHIKSLDLSHCNRITDAGLVSLSDLPNLKSVDLSHCNNITDDALLALSKLPNLESLNLSACDEITDAGLVSLLDLPKLKSVDLSRCNKISSTGVSFLTSSESLKSVDLTRCANIQSKQMSFLKNMASHIEFIH